MDLEFIEPLELTQKQYMEAVTRLPPITHQIVASGNRFYSVMVIDEKNFNRAKLDDEGDLHGYVNALQIDFEIIRDIMDFRWEPRRPILIMPNTDNRYGR